MNLKPKRIFFKNIIICNLNFSFHARREERERERHSQKEKVAFGVCLDQIGHVHWHFIDLCFVVLFNVLKIAHVSAGYEINSCTLTTETT